MPIQTPCNKVCTVDAAARMCVGCGRTLTEIGRWTAFTDQQRAEIMAQLPERLMQLADSGALISEA